jgi:2-dehydro-3-deoxyphosphogluconate aldolase/(4S)-4-hydroxy-2-oxoglutarate aldolase
MDNREICRNIEKYKIIAIIRRIYGSDLLVLAKILYEAGIRFLEITYDQVDKDAEIKTPEAISTIIEKLPIDMIIGAGTVLNERQVESTLKAGGKYIISPNTNQNVIQYTKKAGLISIPGAMTPSEILTAYNAGADIVKVFPASELGYSYFKSIRSPLNHIKLMATGGINDKNISDFIKAGCVGAGVGGALTDANLIREKNFKQLGINAEKIVKSV